MADTATAPALLSETEHRKQLKRAVVASTIGSVIEAYDFLLYSTVTGIVFAKLYFPASDPVLGTLQAYVIFFMGFVARPVGAALFGHYGDRIGRKYTLIVTLLLTGIATFAVGLVPTYNSIGIWGAIILMLLRLIQGIGLGGEWSGSVLLSMEWARGNANRGFLASWTQFGAPAGLALANLALLGFSRLSGDQFLDWGWRIPFLISIVMIAVGLYVRIGILETPVFTKLITDDELASAPAIQVFRSQPKEVFLSALARMAEQGPGYIYGAYMFTYGASVLHAPRDLLLAGLLTASVLGLIWAPIAGHLSDKVGRRRMYTIGAIFSGLYGFFYFTLLDTLSPALIFTAIALSLLPIMTLYGPQAALIAESFAPKLRYSGAGLGFHFASIIAGGPAPFIATALYAAFQTGYAIAGYIMVCGIISIVATSLLRDHTNRDLATAYE
ncbi:MAG: MHS family MFS transporter, partial [Acetobacteraceae bacterium]|nr:MHS family MFS transporter [Acetobacteraceae bacterium]